MPSKRKTAARTPAKRTAAVFTPPPPPPLNALETANVIIYGDREKTHGAPSKNLSAIAGMFSMYLSSKFNQPLVLDAHDVCMLMPLVKIARQANNRNKDNVVDIIGYAALDDRVEEPQQHAIPALIATQ